MIWLVAVTGILSSCGSKGLNKRLTLWRGDKIPYGTYVAWSNLEHLFPNASIVINKKSPDRYKSYSSVKNAKDKEEDDGSYEDRKTTHIIISTEVEPDENESAAILGMVSRGQHVFISSLHVSDIMLDSLHLKTAYYSGGFNADDSLTVSVENPETGSSSSYSYPGKAFDNYFVSIDSSFTTVLGRDKAGHPNFVQFNYEGGGSLYIHLAPVAFSNFFLLHKNNKTYYDNALSYLPKNSDVVRWDDYFRYHKSGNDNSSKKGKGLFGAGSWLSKQPGLARAMWLLLILMLIIYLFESKRKQRVIPVIQPLKNASVDFVKTIGRLYFQRHDNWNLVQKMTAHFQDYVRSKYSIRISLKDPEFEKRLAWKTGYDITALSDLLYHINMLHDTPIVTDESLLELNHKLEHFYKHA